MKIVQTTTECSTDVRMSIDLFCPIWLSLSKYDDRFSDQPYLDF